MSNIRVNAITDEAGTGAPDFPNGYTVAGTVPAAGFSYAAVSGATQALDVGAHNFFDAGTLTADTTISFTNVPTEAQWTYTAEAGVIGGYSLESAVYVAAKSVAAQDGNPFGVAFSPDGTKMFIMGYSSDTVYQYTLGTAWNVSTATYDSISKSVTAQETYPQGVAFSSDGTKMFIAGFGNNTVYQYTLGTAWNVSTATYASISKSVAAQETATREVIFSPDGTKMFVLGTTNNTVYQYTLGTAWNVSTATYSSLSKSVVAQEPISYGLAFSSDGTKMFIVGPGNNTLYQYTLSTAWNVSTATYDSISKTPIGPQASSIAFSPDGAKMFIADLGSDYVYQYSSEELTTITFPPSVQNLTTVTPSSGVRSVYKLFTADGGTTVWSGDF